MSNVVKMKRGATAANDNAQENGETSQVIMPNGVKLSKAQDQARWEKIVALPIGSRVVVNHGIKKWPSGTVLTLHAIDIGVSHIFVSRTISPGAEMGNVCRFSQRAALKLKLMPQGEVD